MKLADLLRLDRAIRAIGFDDAPFVRGAGEPVGVTSGVCANTRFEGMLWTRVEADGLDSTERLCQVLTESKFFPRLHLVLLDGICLGGFNAIDLPLLSSSLNLPCVALMRREPNLDRIYSALSRLPRAEERWQIILKAGEIYHYPPFYFQTRGETPTTIARVLGRLTDRGNVPEALRLAHPIGAAVVKGESGRQA